MTEFELLHHARSAAGLSEGHGTRYPVARVPDLYAFPDPLPERGWVRGSMVSTVDGSVAGPDGLSASISGPPDRIVLAAIRHTADAVLVGLGTARAEGYKRVRPRPEFAERRLVAGQRPAPVLVVITSSGELPDQLIDAADHDGELIVLLTARTAPDRVHALTEALGADQVLVAGKEFVEPDRAMAALVDRGLRRITCEGGPTWLSTMAAAGRLDELCLTTSPLLAGGVRGRILQGAPLGPAEVNLEQLLLSGGMLFSRWIVGR